MSGHFLHIIYYSISDEINYLLYLSVSRRFWSDYLLSTSRQILRICVLSKKKKKLYYVSDGYSETLMIFY